MEMLADEDLELAELLFSFTNNANNKELIPYTEQSIRYLSYFITKYHRKLCSPLRVPVL